MCATQFALLLKQQGLDSHYPRGTLISGGMGIVISDFVSALKAAPATSAANRPAHSQHYVWTTLLFNNRSAPNC
jgi:hypothetical protein